jgi:hypothetical protein
MYEIGNWVNLKKNFSTVIIDCPNGMFKLAGAIPPELTREVKSGFTVTRDSILFDTEDEAVEALLDLGITKFQLADCSWYEV